ncbi:putative enzyme [Klebsiella aerogenes]|nr:putative enzyme [Klebsiella aerogenes]
MSRFRHVELQYASRLLNHGPTILITSYDAPSDRRNVMAAAWSMPGNSPAAGGYRGG